MLIASEVSVSFDPGEDYVKVRVVRKFPNIVVPKSESISVRSEGFSFELLYLVECGANRQVVNGKNDWLRESVEVLEVGKQYNGINFCWVRSFYR